MTLAVEKARKSTDMPPAKPQDAASAAGKTSLAKPPAPATGEWGRQGG
jgi:hypothetical protein